MNLGNYRLKAVPVEPAPGAAPAAVPGAVPAPPILYPAGQTEFAFFYGQCQALDATAGAAVVRAGDTMTGTLNIDTAASKLVLKKAGVQVAAFDANGALDVNLPGDLGVIFQARHSDATDFFVSSTGNAHHRGNLGVGPFADTPAQRLLIKEPNVETWFTQTVDPGLSGGIGWFLNKPDQNLANPHTLIWSVAGTSRWGCGMDFATAATGNADFVSVYDHSSGWNDDGTRAFVGGADIFRFTPAAESNTGKCTQWDLSGQGANRNTTGFFGIIGAGTNLGGVNLSINAGTASPHLLLTQRAAGSKRATISFNLGWLVGQDLLAAGGRDFVLFDAGSTAGNKSRLTITGDNNFGAKFGFNTTNAPLGYHHLLLDQGAGGVTKIETAWTAGYSQDLANRSVNVQQISDGSTVRNWLLMSGQLAGTAAAPTLTSTGAISAGIERTDTQLALALAPGGTAVAIVRPLRCGAANTLGFFDHAPAAKPTITGSRGGNLALADLLTQLAGLGLLTDGTSA